VAVGESVVGHHPLDPHDAVAGEVGHGPEQERCAGVCDFVGQDLSE
jgi:hypothetical protein